MTVDRGNIMLQILWRDYNQSVKFWAKMGDRRHQENAVKKIIPHDLNHSTPGTQRLTFWL